MRRSLSPLLVVTALLCAATPAAAFAGGDGLGIFFDTNGTQSCCTVGADSLLTAYVCAVNISEPSGMAGFEMCIVVDGTVGFLSFDISPGPGQAIDFYPDLTQFGVGYSIPMPYQPVMNLVTIHAYYFYQSGPLKFGVGPTNPTSFGNPLVHPDGPSAGYNAGEDVGLLKPLFPITNVPVPGAPRFFYVAFVNDPTDCPITATENTSWGGVKALYR